MVAHLEPVLSDKGPWMYPWLFWETGVLGQILYLEAHAVGISATGIGCFFDDPGKLCPNLHFTCIMIVLGCIVLSVFLGSQIKECDLVD